MAEATAEQMSLPKHGEFCWMELATTDVEGSKKFYAEMFGWEYRGTNQGSNGDYYPEFNLPNGRAMGGMWTMTEEACGGTIPPPHWMSYIAVDDCEQSVAKCLELGGKVVAQPFDIPNVGRMAVIQDPNGATFSIIKLNS